MAFPANMVMMFSLETQSLLLVTQTQVHPSCRMVAEDIHQQCYLKVLLAST